MLCRKDKFRAHAQCQQMEFLGLAFILFMLGMPYGFICFVNMICVMQSLDATNG